MERNVKKAKLAEKSDFKSAFALVKIKLKTKIIKNWVIVVFTVDNG